MLLKSILSKKGYKQTENTFTFPKTSGTTSKTYTLSLVSKPVSTLSLKVRPVGVRVYVNRRRVATSGRNRVQIKQQVGKRIRVRLVKKNYLTASFRFRFKKRKRAFMKNIRLLPLSLKVKVFVQGAKTKFICKQCKHRKREKNTFFIYGRSGSVKVVVTKGNKEYKDTFKLPKTGIKEVPVKKLFPK